MAILIVGYAAVSGYGLLLLKQADIGINVRFLLGAACYGMGFIVWLWILRVQPLSIAFPIAAGSLMVATQAFGMMIGESMSLTKVFAILLILTGITILSIYGNAQS